MPRPQARRDITDVEKFEKNGVATIEFAIRTLHKILPFRNPEPNPRRSSIVSTELPSIPEMIPGLPPFDEATSMPLRAAAKLLPNHAAASVWCSRGRRR
jgi:hypothetical protein